MQSSSPRFEWTASPLRCRYRPLLFTLMTFSLAGCGGAANPSTVDEPPSEVRACLPGELALEGGGCQPAGLSPNLPCPPGELEAEGGGCDPAGVPPLACGAGFESDGLGGCNPVLPTAACPRGQMAVPGDTACREIAPCGDGTYGDIPVDSTTQFVNQAYTGTDSDGTEARPWTTILSGIRAASPGAIVALAAGRYAEEVIIGTNPVRLWGRCPQQVAITGNNAGPIAVTVHFPRAAGTELHNFAITGAPQGIEVSGVQSVVLDRLWIHDLTDYGIIAHDAQGVARVAVRASLIERAGSVGLAISGTEVAVDATVIRETQLGVEGQDGWGAVVLNSPIGTPGLLNLRGSLLERNRQAGVAIQGGEAMIDATVIRDTRAEALGGGRGVVVTDDEMGSADN